MNKTLLLAGAAVIMTAASANAIEYTPYVSAKAAWVRMQNDANVNADYVYKRTFPNTATDKTHKDDVFGLRVAAGVATPVKYGKLRGELEFGWNDDAKDSNDFNFTILNSYTHKYSLETSVYAGMVNFYYDIDTGTRFTPYVGAGLGYAHIKAKSNVKGTTPSGVFNMSSSTSENNLAWNVGFGASYALTDHVSLDGGYRYTDYGNIKDSESYPKVGGDGTLNTGGKFDVDSHELYLGARYAF